MATLSLLLQVFVPVTFNVVVFGSRLDVLVLLKVLDLRMAPSDRRQSRLYVYNKQIVRPIVALHALSFGGLSRARRAHRRGIHDGVRLADVVGMAMDSFSE